MANSAEPFFSGCPGTLVLFSSQNLPILSPAIGTCALSDRFCTSKLTRKHGGKSCRYPQKCDSCEGDDLERPDPRGIAVVSDSMSFERSESLFSSGRHVRSVQGSPAK